LCLIQYEQPFGAHSSAVELLAFNQRVLSSNLSAPKLSF
jgi:hypothetical protein